MQSYSNQTHKQKKEVLAHSQQIGYEKVQVPVVEYMESPLKNAHEYLYGIGKNQNIAKALDIYQKEADKSNPEAQICLGQILKQGNFMEVDLIKVLKIFDHLTLNARQNNAEGLYHARKFNTRTVWHGKHVRGYKPYKLILKMVKLALQNLHQSAKLEHLDSLVELGQIYYNGISDHNEDRFILQPNMHLAEQYLEKATSKNYAKGIYYLGNILEFVKKDYIKAFAHYTQAKNLFYFDAYYDYSRCERSGIGTKKNIVMANIHLEEGALGGSTQCMLEYLKVLQEDIMVQQDDESIQIMEEFLEKMKKIKNSHPDLYFYKGQVNRENKQLANHYYKKGASKNSQLCLSQLKIKISENAKQKDQFESIKIAESIVQRSQTYSGINGKQDSQVSQKESKRKVNQQNHNEQSFLFSLLSSDHNIQAGVQPSKTQFSQSNGQSKQDEYTSLNNLPILDSSTFPI